MKRVIAARVAAAMRKEGADVAVERGGMGELTVWVDGAEVVTAKGIGYPNPWRVMKRVREAVRA